MTLAVSDHAVLRYLERCQGVDVEAVRAAIAAKADDPAGRGARVVTVDGVILCIGRRGGQPIVTTALGLDMRPQKRPGRGCRR